MDTREEAKATERSHSDASALSRLSLPPDYSEWRGGS